MSGFKLPSYTKKLTREERKLNIMRQALSRSGGALTMFGGVDKDHMNWAKPKPVTLPKLHFMRELPDV